MEELSVIQSFMPITLDDMKSIRLMNRTDTKYVTTRKKLCEWLAVARNEYYVQDMDGERLLPYHTIYLDTPELTMYMEHHNKRAHRQKVRVREYEVDHAMFLEVKDKNNHGRTKKKRISVNNMELDTQEKLEFVDSNIMWDANKLDKKIENRFQRITLVNYDKTERLTIDTNLQFKNLVTGISTTLPDHVIIELKRDGLTHSPAIGLLREMRILPCGFSKYCIGMAMTDPDLKKNNFKERLRYLNKLVINQ